MTQYDNRNKGIVSKNDRKSQDNHPDITGSINVDGVEYFLDGWMKKRKDDGRPFYSLSVKRKDKQPEPQRGGDYGAAKGGQHSAPARDELSDEIPF